MEAKKAPRFQVVDTEETPDVLADALKLYKTSKPLMRSGDSAAATDKLHAALVLLRDINLQDEAVANGDKLAQLQNNQLRKRHTDLVVESHLGLAELYWQAGQKDSALQHYDAAVAAVEAGLEVL